MGKEGSRGRGGAEAVGAKIFLSAFWGGVQCFSAGHCTGASLTTRVPGAATFSVPLPLPFSPLSSSCSCPPSSLQSGFYQVDPQDKSASSLSLNIPNVEGSCRANKA